MRLESLSLKKESSKDKYSRQPEESKKREVIRAKHSDQSDKNANKSDMIPIALQDNPSASKTSEKIESAIV